MVFEHKNATERDGELHIEKEVFAKANAVLDKTVLREFWKGFTFGGSEIDFTRVDDFTFSVGKAKKIECENYSYAINVEREGVFISADGEKSLIRAFVTFLDLIKCDEDGVPTVKCVEIKEKALIEKRMIHFCIFPETELWQIERFIRLCGALKYTHIVFEFWGMYKYECLKELAWECAFSKEQIKPLIQTANDLGMEIIPMFNHWGHASQSRQIYGKHTVLSQNPKLQYLFTDDGWRWRIQSKKTRELLRCVRRELTELCGEGEYFLIGCDEADGFGFSKEESDEICEYINEIAGELAARGRKTIMWADMLLAPDPSYNKENAYCTNAPTKQASDYLLEHLDKNIILADWQYEVKKAPAETSLLLKEKGFDVLLCPWSIGWENVTACIDTVSEHKLCGLLHTTWHTLSNGMPHVLKAAVNCQSECERTGQVYATHTAALLRKAYPCDGDYDKAGWSIKQIEW